MTADAKLSAKVLQDMIQADYEKKFDRYETIYNTEEPGKSPSDVSFEKTN